MYAGASLAPQGSLLLLSSPTTASVIAITLRPPLLSFSRSSLLPTSPNVRFRSSAPCSLNPSRRSRSKWESEGVWEDPDDGYGSEYEEREGLEEEDDDEVEEEDEDGGGEARGAKPSHLGIAKSATAQFDEELVREVELLLTPEEKAILDQNEAPNLSKISTLKWHPLHSFALAGQIPFMDKLLETGTHIDSFDKDGFTPLHKAVIGKKEAVISHLLRKGANPHVTDRDGATPLHYAVQVGAMQTVKLLIKYKVDVNVADNEGWTPLHVAIQSRSRDIAKVLLVNGADKSRRNKDGKTPLDLSLCYGKDFKSYDLAKLLKLVPANRDP